MKLNIKLIALALITLLVACKGSGDKNEEAKTAYAEATKDDANDIIEYNNVLVGFTDQNNSYLKSIESSLERIKKGFEKPEDTFAFLGIITPIPTPFFSNSKMKPEIPPSALSSEDQKFFKENVTGLSTTINKIRDTYKSLNDYIKAEDWKDDKGVKGKLLVDSIYLMNKKYYTYDEKVLAKLEVIGDDAEKIILKSHPLKEYILALKEDKKVVDDFNKLLEKNADNYKVAESKIKTAYTKLEEKNMEHKSMDVPNTSKFPGKDMSFNRFNESFSDYLIQARKTMRDASATGKITQNNGENLIRYQDYIRTAYNNFVD